MFDISSQSNRIPGGDEKIKSLINICLVLISNLPIISYTFLFLVPSASPTLLVASRINSSNHIKLSWIPVPSSDINAPVLLGYIINYKETAKSAFLSNKTENTWIELHLPNNDTEYTFTVSGYNKKGVGPNISLAYIFPSLNTSSTGNNSVGNDNTTSNVSGPRNRTHLGKLKRENHTLAHACSCFYGP